MDCQPPGDFPSTPWSVVYQAATTGSPEHKQALNRLCESYWYPLYVFVRRSGHSHDDAPDLVQGFFSHFLEKNYFRSLSPDRGRFRSYLRSAMDHFLANERDRESAKKRGGGAAPIPLDIDFQNGASRYAVEPATEETPEHIYDRKWTVTLLRNAMARLEKGYGNPEKFQILASFLPGSRNEMTYAEAAARLDLSLSATKSTIHRLRARYREALTSEIARTVDSRAEIEAEYRYLLEVLGR